MAIHVAGAIALSSVQLIHNCIGAIIIVTFCKSLTTGSIRIFTVRSHFARRVLGVPELFVVHVSWRSATASILKAVDHTNTLTELMDT